MDPEVTTRARALLVDAGALGLDRRALERRAGVLREDAGGVMSALVDSGEATALGRDRWVRSEALDNLAAQATARVDAFHDDSPLQPGIGRATLEGALGGRVAPDVAAAAVDLACARGDLHHFADQGLLTRPGRGLAEGELPPALRRIVDLYEDGGIAPPTLKEVEAATGMTSRALLDAISTLQRLGALVRITNDLSLAAASHDALVAAVREHLREHAEIDVQALKGVTGLSRKFVVPLLEHFDRIQLTRREGDRRIAGGRAGL
jgi:selenocysteine-specific elongation factor